MLSIPKTNSEDSELILLMKLHSTPKAVSIVKKSEKLSKRLKLAAVQIDENVYDIIDDSCEEREANLVSIEPLRCTCRTFSIYKLPCHHIIFLSRKTSLPFSPEIIPAHFKVTAVKESEKSSVCAKTTKEISNTSISFSFALKLFHFLQSSSF